MVHTYLNRGLVLSATLLLASTASTASADPATANTAATGKADTKVEKAEAKAEKAADKVEAKLDKVEGKPAALGDKADKKDTDAKPSDRAARRAAQHEAQKEKLRGVLKAPMDEAAKQELRRHAERVAKLERIKALATESKDKDIAERAGKLLDKENARHEKFLATHAKVEGTVPAKADEKGGAR